MTATEHAPSYQYVGTRPIRHDGLEKVTGKARFAADLDLTGQLRGAMVRSPYAHARIVSIDTSEAEAMPGVKAVVTGADFPAIDINDPIHDEAVNVIARDEVYYHGHVVAAVAATTAAGARAAAAAVKVRYEDLPAILSIDDALADGAPIANSTNRTLFTGDTEPSNLASVAQFDRGDVEAGFAEADLVVEREFTTKPVHQGYIEPHACVADCNQEGRATIWASSQGHFMVRSRTAAVLGWGPEKIKVTPAEIGGGFGGKTTIYLEPLAVMLSQKSGRPVKMVMTREEVMRATGPAPAAKMWAKIGATKDGELTTLEADLRYSNGSFKGYAALTGAMSIASYKFPNLLLKATGTIDNTPKSAAYRAPSAPQAAFAIETLIDELAVGLGMDPIELRLKNAVAEGDPTAMGAPHPKIGFVEVLEALRDSDHYNSPVPEGAGRGMATGFWFNIGEQSSATVHLNEDGTATVMTGSPDIGGSRASMALMAAEELGLDVHHITPTVVDTESISITDITEGSRATFATGMAVVHACRDLIGQMKERAALMRQVDVDQVAWIGGAAVIEGAASEGQDPVSIAEIAGAAKMTGGPLIASASLNASGAGPSFAAHLADVAVDEETGQVTVLRYTAVQDAGTAIHPSYVEGQMQGGAVQGIGWALNEEYVYDDDGVLQNAGFLDYRMPVASDLPMIDTVIVEVPNPAHPYGVRGVGETGIVPPIPTVANAIADATGVRMTDLPMSPPNLLKALDER
ncbi:MAG: xanthine dehydrogenase family protein molybdopterin-binding subunit [Actinobacteria bacterium]|nr:xanthine dehydrogenase family protein molybdopterin-binding subunit [Actinomycetota bacterium]NIT98080.1 xanthine dehydrogenase family protein molybdopterin-binding subunit [Actinomycetota bacterium]NIU21715.1 xanthine dehydrogenase family protein molybdopterin-binding subunit [Actinomycetota bacterium]NIU68321.1 xanthine dehydrogenase family protein molybdopterin-binding subunit [Actinomycetota bacterium]NIV58249.1 molybdopterin-dependent oxidoreductase [Actinomycetota bacterium]